MTEPFYRLPDDLADDIETYSQDVRRFLDGDVPVGIFKAKRVPRGVYEQRQDGTYMVRVRVAGGTLNREQACELAALSLDFGDGLLHVTTRQDVQLHGVAIADTPEVMRRLMGVGLTSKGGGGNTVRNITACPFAGICPHERFDVTPFAHAVTEYLIPLVGSYNLPRKYKIAFSGCAVDCAMAQMADLGFVAEVRDGVPGFRVLSGGGMGANTRVADELIEWTPVSEVIRIAESVRRLFDQHGDRNNRSRARLRFVFERLGLAEVTKAFDAQMAAVTADGVPEWQGDVVICDPIEAPASGPPRADASGGLRSIPQRQDGFVAVPLHLPLGFISASAFARVAEIAATFSGEKGLRTTRMQNLLVRFVSPSDLDALNTELQALDCDVISPHALERFVACAGASTCRLGLCLARDAARACADALAVGEVDYETLGAMEVYINGCPNACGHHPVGPIGLSGSAQRKEGRLIPSYRITAGGCCGADGARLGVPVGQIPAKALPGFMKTVGEEFQSKRQGDESFSAYVARLGASPFKALVSQYAELPSYQDQPDFYRDFGAGDDFSLAGRGAGECGSGVFEVIQSDLTAARKGTTPFATVVPAARALLITRGVEAQDPDAVFREFEKHFVDTGLVAEDFRALLTRARAFSEGWGEALDGYQPSVEALLARVDLLYSTLDSGLEFHPPPEGESGGATEIAGESSGGCVGGGESGARDSEVVELDLGGVTCPMNFVKAKLKLETMAAGDRLLVMLDEGEPIRNVPASLMGEGHEIEDTRDLGDGRWQIVVRKAAEG